MSEPVTFSELSKAWIDYRACLKLGSGYMCALAYGKVLMLQAQYAVEEL